MSSGYRRSKAELYYHFVWATNQRSPYLVGETERAIYRFLGDESERMGCAVKAIGGMPDHVHLALELPPTLSPAQVAKQHKGGSSRFVGEQVDRFGYFQWQRNYSVFTLSRPHVADVVKYIDNQKAHHTSGHLWHALEETDEAADD